MQGGEADEASAEIDLAGDQAMWPHRVDVERMALVPSVACYGLAAHQFAMSRR